MPTVSPNPFTAIMLHLQQVTDDLGKLASNPAAHSCEARPRAAACLASQADLVLSHRRLRRRFFPVDLFREPGWDMLLAVYVADRAGRPTNVKSLVAMADAPATTSQRWLDYLDRSGLVSRTTDPLDRRRVDVSLTDAGRTAMDAYLEAIRTA